MKVRSESEFTDHVIEQLAWRRKELSDFRLALQGHRTRSADARFLLRAAHSFAYAHWEGFVKDGASAFIAYISTIRPKHSALAINLLALAVQQKVSSEGSSFVAYTKGVQLLTTQAEEGVALKQRGTIDTRANLSFETFTEIAQIVGIDIDRYRTKKQFIDETLVKGRNAIAHGEYRIVLPQNCYDTLRVVDTLLMDVKDDLLDIVQNKAYLKSK